MNARACECGHLCPSCNARWDRDVRVVVHEDNCPRLAAMRSHDGPCQAAAFGFCGCPGGHS